MNPNISTIEGVIKQLKYLSKRYEELLKLIDEMENPIPQQIAKKPLWATIFKKIFKKPRS